MRLALGAASFALMLAGCADLRRSVSLPPVNPESPVAPAVAAGARGNYEVPRLNDVPPLPKNVPAAAIVKAGVLSMVRCRGGVERFAVTHPPLSAGAEQFAANARDVAQVNPADVPPPDSTARTDAYAEGLRAAAAPPTAIASGAPPTPEQGKPPVPPVPSGPKPARQAAARRARAPAAKAPVQTAAAAAPAPGPAAPPTAAPSQASQASASPPPLPAPLPDPLLARCT